MITRKSDCGKPIYLGTAHVLNSSWVRTQENAHRNCVRQIGAGSNFAPRTSNSDMNVV
jgi:hypothetical protein